MTDALADILGDYRGFAARQRDRMLERGIDLGPYGLSHLAYRVPEWDQYVDVRTRLERHAAANSENVWNGRPISLIVLAIVVFAVVFYWLNKHGSRVAL